MGERESSKGERVCLTVIFLFWCRDKLCSKPFGVKCLRAPRGDPPTSPSSGVGEEEAQDVDREAPAIRTERSPQTEHRPLCVLPESLGRPRQLEGPTKPRLFSPDIRPRPQDFSVLLGQDLTG